MVNKRKILGAGCSGYSAIILHVLEHKTLSSIPQYCKIILRSFGYNYKQIICLTYEDLAELLGLHKRKAEWGNV